MQRSRTTSGWGALGLTVATLVSTIVALAAAPGTFSYGLSCSDMPATARFGGAASGLTATAFALAVLATIAAGYAQVARSAKSWIVAAALLFVVFQLELICFTLLASYVGAYNEVQIKALQVSYCAGFAFQVVAALLAFPTMALCVVASRTQEPAEAFKAHDGPAAHV
jgi:hypothetical protein